MNRPERYINLGRRSTLVARRQERRGGEEREGKSTREKCRSQSHATAADGRLCSPPLARRKREKEEEEEGAAGHALNSPVPRQRSTQWLAQSRKHRPQLESANSIEKRRDSVNHRATRNVLLCSLKYLAQNWEPTGINRRDGATFTPPCELGFEWHCRQRDVAAVAAASAAPGGQYTTGPRPRRQRQRGKGRHVSSS